MQVFTKVYLLETFAANVQQLEETLDVDQDLPAAYEFREILRERIDQLEKTRGRSGFA